VDNSSLHSCSIPQFGHYFAHVRSRTSRVVVSTTVAFNQCTAALRMQMPFCMPNKSPPAMTLLPCLPLVCHIIGLYSFVFINTLSASTLSYSLHLLHTALLLMTVLILTFHLSRLLFINGSLYEALSCPLLLRVLKRTIKKYTNKKYERTDLY
jgi:hypothetical protein